jgi:hypothetical protein
MIDCAKLKHEANLRESRNSAPACPEVPHCTFAYFIGNLFGPIDLGDSVQRMFLVRNRGCSALRG